MSPKADPSFASPEFDKRIFSDGVGFIQSDNSRVKIHMGGGQVSYKILPRLESGFYLKYVSCRSLISKRGT